MWPALIGPVESARARRVVRDYLSKHSLSSKNVLFNWGFVVEIRDGPIAVFWLSINL